MSVAKCLEVSVTAHSFCSLEPRMSCPAWLPCTALSLSAAVRPYCLAFFWYILKAVQAAHYSQEK